MTMDRRTFLKFAGACSATLAMTGRIGAQPARSKDVGKRPNLLIIHTDQLSLWALSAYAPSLTKVPNYGKVLVHTPHIDSIAQQGALFANFFTNSALCTPSRGCLLTGRYPTSHGAYQNNIELGRDEVTIAEVLRRHGYRTGYAGKWHLDGPPKPGWVKPDRAMGFEDCRFMFNRGHWKKIVDRPGEQPQVFPYNVIGDSSNYTTDWLANKTIEFIDAHAHEPFFYMVSFPDPHTPFTVRPPYMDMFDPAQMVVPETYQPSRGRPGARERGIQRLRRVKAHYCGLVKCIDDNVRRILSALKRNGIYDDTIVVFTTDHGEYMGEHGLYGKNRWYRTAYQIPLMIRWPRKIRPGTIVEHFVTTVDIQPTLLGLMGLEPCGREQGTDASALLTGRSNRWHDEALIHHSSLDSAGIFTPQFELILRADGNHMLFDRVNDPEQLHNLFGQDRYAKVVRQLTERILQHHLQLNGREVSWLRPIAHQLAGS